MSGMKEVKATAHVHAAPAPRASLQKCVKGGSRAGSDEQAHCQGARVGAHAGDKTSFGSPGRRDGKASPCMYLSTRELYCTIFRGKAKETVAPTPTVRATGSFPRSRATVCTCS